MNNSKKNKLMASAIPVIIFALYTLVVMLVFKEKEGGFWISWGFSFIATLITLAVPALIVKEGKEVKSIFQGFSIAAVTTLYFVAQLVLGFILIVASFLPIFIVVILEVLLLGAYAVILILSFMGKNIVTNLEQNQKEKVYFVKSIAVDLSMVANKISDETAKKLVNKIAETAKYSDPMSSPSLAGLEAQISIKVEELKNSTDENDVEKITTVANKIEELFTERNEKCKLLK